MARIVSTSIPYVNANPHIGHALEYVEADAYVRTLKLQGEEVLFITGTDDNALKNVQAAEKEGAGVQQFVDERAEAFKKMCADFNINYDVFVRTSGNSDHTKASQTLWNACLASEDLYKKAYTGYYCVGCEEFKIEKDLVDKECPLHRGKELENVEEENWFFKLTKYQDRLGKLLESQEMRLLPESRKNEMLAFIRGGLQDFSVSRSVARAKGWGIPVPGDETQIMYVWFDALVNYLTGSGYPASLAQWEGATERTHFVGKDITRFHAIYWPAILLSAGIPLPTSIFSHGFITSEGQKMSKSVGNVIAPGELLEKYGAEAARYFLLRHVHPTEDTDITWERLDEWYTANLVNGLGNVVDRIMKLAEDNLPEPVSRPESDSLVLKYWKDLESFSFNGVLDSIWREIALLDERITREEPFKVVKTNPEEGRRMIAQLATQLYVCARLINPFMPETSKLIKEAVLANKKPQNLFPRLPAQAGLT